MQFDDKQEAAPQGLHSNGTVGYGNPPRGLCFQAGVSGNPKGRPKQEGSSVAEHIKRLLDTPLEEPGQFLLQHLHGPQYGFHEFHATIVDNPLLPKRAGNESVEAWLAHRAGFHEDLSKGNDPLVYAQQYLAEFVDWSRVAFFSREKLLVDSQPLPLPARCDAVFVVIDTASKTETDNDALRWLSSRPTASVESRF